eukprot:6165767-Prymnesium_polylepis.1
MSDEANAPAASAGPDPEGAAAEEAAAPPSTPAPAAAQVRPAARPYRGHLSPRFVWVVGHLR